MSKIVLYPANDCDFDAADVAAYLAGLTSGVFSGAEDFPVTAAGGLTVTVGAGRGWVHPSRFTGYSITKREADTLALPLADPSLPRIDRIVMRYDAGARAVSLQVLQGTASNTPTAPAISRTELIYDLCLAEIKRPAGSTAVTAADIYDTRADETVCGVMRDGVHGIPTGTLVQQWKAVIESMRGGSFYTRAEVDALLKSLKSVDPFPVGSIYQSTARTSPAALFGGTWQEIAQNRVLMGAGSGHAAGTTVEAGLPNITGSFVADVKKGEHKVSGAFTAGSEIATTGEYNNFSDVYKFSLDASKSNAIYGRSATVQPAAYYVHIWRRVA
mgnify:CR=1 FL=1